MTEVWDGYAVDTERLDRLVDALGGVMSPDALHVAAGGDAEFLFESTSRQVSMSMNTDSCHAHGEVAMLDGAEISDNDFFTAVDEEMAKVDKFISAKVADIRAHTYSLEAEVNAYCANFKRDPTIISDFSDRAHKAGQEFLTIEQFTNKNFAAFRLMLEKHDEFLPKVPCLKFYLAKLHQVRSHIYFILGVVLLVCF
jgi:hypothetical protein